MSDANGHSGNGHHRQKTPREAAIYYHERGRLPIPVHFQTKTPVGDGWQHQRPTPEDLDRLFPDGKRLNVGLLLGGRAAG